MKLILENLSHEQHMRWLDKRDIFIQNTVQQLQTLAREYDIPQSELLDIYYEIGDRFEKTQPRNNTD
jgi:hypothetical protein